MLKLCPFVYVGCACIIVLRPSFFMPLSQPDLGPGALFAELFRASKIIMPKDMTMRILRWPPVLLHWCLGSYMSSKTVVSPLLNLQSVSMSTQIPANLVFLISTVNLFVKSGFPIALPTKLNPHLFHNPWEVLYKVPQKAWF